MTLGMKESLTFFPNSALLSLREASFDEKLFTFRERLFSLFKKIYKEEERSLKTLGEYNGFLSLFSSSPVGLVVVGPSEKLSSSLLLQRESGFFFFIGMDSETLV